MRKAWVLLLCLSQPSWGAVAFVQCVNQYTVAGNTTITGTVAGNALTVCGSNSGSVSRTVSDGHNTYVHPVFVTGTINGTLETINCSYALNIAGGTENLNESVTGSDDGLTVCEFSGVASFDVSSTTVSGAGATTTPTLAAMTTAGTGLVIMQYANEVSGGEATAGTGYTIDSHRSTNHFDALEYKVDVSAGSQTPFVTVTSNNNWMLASMAFTASAGGATAKVTNSIIGSHIGALP